jgi:hypothetical protein
MQQHGNEIVGRHFIMGQNVLFQIPVSLYPFVECAMSHLEQE